MLHGGVNDAWDSIPAGKRSKGLELANFDHPPARGGLEELFFHVKKYFPETKVCFDCEFQSTFLSYRQDFGHDRVFRGDSCHLPEMVRTLSGFMHDEDFSKEFRVAEKVHTADFIHSRWAAATTCSIRLSKNS